MKTLLTICLALFLSGCGAGHNYGVTHGLVSGSVTCATGYLARDLGAPKWVENTSQVLVGAAITNYYYEREKVARMNGDFTEWHIDYGSTDTQADVIVPGIASAVAVWKC